MKINDSSGKIQLLWSTGGFNGFHSSETAKITQQNSESVHFHLETGCLDLRHPNSTLPGTATPPNPGDPTRFCAVQRLKKSWENPQQIQTSNGWLGLLGLPWIMTIPVYPSLFATTP